MRNSKRKVIRSTYIGLAASLVAGCGEDDAERCDPNRQLAGSICLEQVVGAVVDEKGSPIPDLPVTVCGPICFRGVTDSAGEFVVELNEYLLPADYSVQPHGTPTGSTFYYPIATDFGGGVYQAGTLRVLPLPSEGDLFISKTDLAKGEVAPAQTLVSGPLELQVAEGTLVRLSILDVLEGNEGRMFRASELEAAFVREFTPELEGCRVFALGPFEVEFSGENGIAPVVNVSLQNSLKWPAGEKIAVLGLGTYLDPDWISPSEFEELGVAIVSEDAARIELEVDEQARGLRHLTWLAFVPP